MQSLFWLLIIVLNTQYHYIDPQQRAHYAVFGYYFCDLMFLNQAIHTFVFHSIFLSKHKGHFTSQNRRKTIFLRWSWGYFILEIKVKESVFTLWIHCCTSGIPILDDRSTKGVEDIWRVWARSYASLLDDMYVSNGRLTRSVWRSIRLFKAIYVAAVVVVHVGKATCHRRCVAEMWRRTNGTRTDHKMVSMRT